MIDLQTKKTILKSYLRGFSVPLTSEELDLFRETFTHFESTFVLGNASFLRKVGCFFLLHFGKKTYIKTDSYDIIEGYFGRLETDGIWYDVSTPFLIIYHHKQTAGNSLQMDLISHILVRRSRAGKPTLILSETSLPDVEEVFVTINKKIFKKGIQFQFEEQKITNKVKDKSDGNDHLV